MPVANPVRDLTKNQSRGKWGSSTGKRGRAHAGGTTRSPLRFAGCNDARARVALRDNTYALRLRREGFNRPLSPWHFRGWGADFIVSRTESVHSRQGFFFSPRMCGTRVRVEAVIFSVFSRERGSSLFLFKTIASEVSLPLSRYNLFYNIKEIITGNILLIIAASVNWQAILFIENIEKDRHLSYIFNFYRCIFL